MTDAVDRHVKITSRRLPGVGLFVAAALALAESMMWAEDEVLFSGPRVDLPIDQLESRSWGREDGLPSADVFDLLQSQDGHLWIATDGGLARFDGVKFTVFDQENTSALGSNQIRRLGESRDGTVWAGTKDGGLTAFRPGRHRRAKAIEALADVLFETLLAVANANRGNQDVLTNFFSPSLAGGPALAAGGGGGSDSSASSDSSGSGSSEDFSSSTSSLS